MMGKIVQLNVSDGGVPKYPITTAMVTEKGLTGDRQANLKYHGGPDRAVCLWSQEIIATLQAAGHPIESGSAGENITISGLDWATLCPGRRLQLGPTVQLEITDYAAPCRQNARWFSDRRYSRMSQNHYPGQSRLYARVLQSGQIYPGDTVTMVRT
ncbi:MAG: MOSC domain-containing protein [Cyanobacteria bacterium P01_A01_bin.123]